MNKWIKISVCLRCRQEKRIKTKPPDGFNINGFCKSLQCGNTRGFINYRIIPDGLLRVYDNQTL